MMRGKISNKIHVHGLDLVFIALGIESIVAFSTASRLQPQQDEQLKILAAIVLENVRDVVLPRQLLILFLIAGKSFRYS